MQEEALPLLADGIAGVYFSPLWKPVGCDLELGSLSEVDECGICGGNGTSCKSPAFAWSETPFSQCSVTCGGGTYVMPHHPECSPGRGNPSKLNYWLSTAMLPKYAGCLCLWSRFLSFLRKQPLELWLGQFQDTPSPSWYHALIGCHAAFLPCSSFHFIFHLP